jgi:hypothetical protein
MSRDRPRARPSLPDGGQRSGGSNRCETLVDQLPRAALRSRDGKVNAPGQTATPRQYARRAPAYAPLASRLDDHCGMSASVKPDHAAGRPFSVLLARYGRHVHQLFDRSWDELDASSVNRFMTEAGDEGLLWEAKGAATPRQDSVLKAVCGFANSVGGYLILGAGQRLDARRRGVSNPGAGDVGQLNHRHRRCLSRARIRRQAPYDRGRSQRSRGSS